MLIKIFKYLAERLWSDTSSDISHLGTVENALKQTVSSTVGENTDIVGADHEYHEISDEENRNSPLKFDKPLNFDFGPSLLDEMDQIFRSLGIYVSLFTLVKIITLPHL